MSPVRKYREVMRQTRTIFLHEFWTLFDLMPDNFPQQVSEQFDYINDLRNRYINFFQDRGASGAFVDRMKIINNVYYAMGMYLAEKESPGQGLIWKLSR
jgi:lysyl-tRNA synthetase class II